MIQKIARIPLREAFPREASDFTRWLRDNLDVLNDVTDLNLSNAERERAAGDFNVDLVAEDENDSKVIIENQLERTWERTWGHSILDMGSGFPFLTIFEMPC